MFVPASPDALPHRARRAAGLRRRAARLLTHGLIALGCTLTSLPTMTAEPEDPYLWLEDVQGERALDWVRGRNRLTTDTLAAEPGFETLRARLLALLDSKDRIAGITRRGDWLYNFWQDDAHRRGLWRRTTLEEYRRAEPRWDVLLDLDALAAAEGENWVWAGANCLAPDDRHCLLSLSRGGADAHVVREFDLAGRRFVEGGFVLPEAKSDVAWVDPDTLYVGTDFGLGSLTESGYPRVIRRWRRGTPLAQATTVFEARSTDVSAHVSVDRTPGFERTIFTRSIDFYRSERFLLRGDRLVRLALPADAQFGFMHSAGERSDTLLIGLRSDWRAGGRRLRSGSLLATDWPAFMAGERRFQVLFEPAASRSLAGWAVTRRHVILNILDDVAGRLEEWKRGPAGFERRAIAAPHPGKLTVASLADPMRQDDPLAESYAIQYADFLTPDTLLLGHTGSDLHETLKALPASFDAQGMRVEQQFATSRDGTRVPYFVVWPRGARPDGRNPTLLYGYGGFRISLTPWYSRAYGAAWFERGGVLVVANIRGGGEFGPAWHQAALKEHRQRSYDDFIAVAEDLIARRVTSPRHLGIEGGSNGGLLVGAAFTQRPDLFGAVICQVPLLDMKRYHRLLAGASWMAEYGDPDRAEDWAWISRYSPYQNVRPGVTYPRVLFTTSTRDDRVHPGHARKMAARMLEQGHAPLYYENIEGGHGGAADNAQRAFMQALEFTFAWQQLGQAADAAPPR